MFFMYNTFGKYYFAFFDKKFGCFKRKDRFFQLVDLGKSIPEIDDTRMTRAEMYAKLDKGIEDYKKGRTKTLNVEDINSFLDHYGDK